MKYSREEIHAYLVHNWYDNDSLSDFNMAIDSGFTEYAAFIIEGSGAIDPKNGGAEKAIVEMLKGYDPQKDIKECFDSATVYHNPETGEHLYVKNDYVNYLIDIKDFDGEWIECSKEKSE